MKRIAALAVTFVIAAALPLCGAVGAAWALDPAKRIGQYRLSQWGVDDGLPHGSVHLITEDTQGFLWLGTLVGISRFDGVSFRPAMSADDSRIDYFTRAAVFQGDEAWTVLHEGGVARRIGQRWQTFALQDVGNARALTPRKSGGYWLGTDRGLYRMSVVAGQPVIAPAPAELRVAIWFLREEDDGRLWACTENGTHLYEPDKGWRHLESEFGLPPRVSWMVHRDRAGVFWLAGRNGLIRYDGVRHRRYGVEDGLALATVRHIAEDREGSLWIATPGGGLQRFRDNRFETLDNKGGLASDSVMSVYVDSADNVWFGMAGGGFGRLSDIPLRVLRKHDGLTGDWIWTVHQDADGDIWIGTNGNGLTVLRGDAPLRRIPGAAGLDTVWGMHAWDAGRAIVSSTHGIARIERNDALTWLAPSRPGEALPRIFLRLRDERLLMARGNALQEITSHGIVPTRFPAAEGAIVAMVELDGGELAIATRAQGIVAIAEDKPPRTILPPQRAAITSLKRDGKGRLWASANGVLIVDGSRHVRIAAANGFPDRYSNEVILAGSDMAWVTTNRGIIRTTQSELLHCLDDAACRPAFDVLSERDGLPTAETNGGAQPSSWIDRDGHIWLPTINGLIRIDDARGVRAISPRKVAIDGIRADRKWIETTNVVPAYTRDVEIDYSIAELTLPKRVQFRYRLLPQQAEWVDVGTRRTAFFSVLPPGRYRFEVIAATGRSGWPEHGSILEFDVEAAWYQTLPAHIAFAALLLAGLVLVPWLRIRALRHRKATLERDVVARTAELAAANIELDRLVKTDALTGIANRRVFGEALATTCASFRGSGVLAVLIGDIDDFKAYNDQYGHPEGDACLIAVAQTIDAAVRAVGGLACRYGGEEFAAMAALPDRAAAEALAARIVDDVRALNRPHAQSSVASIVTLSVGVHALPPGATMPAAMLRDADRALYQAKSEGRNRWIRWRGMESYLVDG